MAKFSQRSKDALATCHPDLQLIAMEAIKIVDFTVVQGHRSIAEQQRLYAQGRTMPGPIVTRVDGINQIGKHNRDPSLAFDAVPWVPGIGMDWNNRERFHVMGGIFLGIAAARCLKVRWGGNWDSDPYFSEPGDNWDLPHLELL